MEKRRTEPAADEAHEANEARAVVPTGRPGQFSSTGIGRHLTASALGLGRNAWLLPLDVAFRTVGVRYGWLRSLFRSVPAPIIAVSGRLRAERAAWRALHRVPAYRAYLTANHLDPDRFYPAGILESLPETDKQRYIDAYPLKDRCVDGRIRFKGVTIDESSGSTGTPYNWIRGAAERRIAHRNIAFFARYAYGKGDLVTLNAFSMGAWATGFNMSLALNRHGLVKSIGPDIGKILSTLDYLGPSYRYLICGYPPFLKHLLDEGERAGFPWASFGLSALVGGEGMAEELRDRLLERFEVVYSGYGATDLEIGMAAESPVSVALRRMARARPEVRRDLFGGDPRLPMVFQYNPLIHYLETNQRGELLCTVSRLDLMTPRIRYNVHDAGGLLSYGGVRRSLSRLGLDIERLGTYPEAAGPRGPLPWSEPLPLPFVYVFGRRDATISVMGANIYPEDLESIIYAEPELIRDLESFMLTMALDDDGNPRPGIALEARTGADFDADRLASVTEQIREGLRRLNLDFREAYLEYPAAMEPIVTAYPPGLGPFAGDAGRIKPRRIAAG